jgi:hypothetical protein
MEGEAKPGGRWRSRHAHHLASRQPDEKQRLDACEAALERQIEELKARVAELEAALERKAEAMTEALMEEGSEAECQRGVTCRRVRMVAAAAPDDRERAAPKRGQLTWAQWKSLVVRDGVLERLWESVDGRPKTAQVVIPRIKVKEVLTEMHGGPSGGHFGANKTLAKVRQRYYWLHSRDNVERWCRQCDICAASRGPLTRTRGLMHQYNVGAPFEGVAIHITGPFP